ncbi:hypothetical protein GCM10010995_28590 [Cysteiniphilum litorale]|uniref:Uncharacterized protein n=2 Tax=Fastidiosibacteraceae TaxID=2056687 RepID=A0A8J3EAL9_9GAMM|nr:hypothetical protein GCM10010995_28590 [Cysteiniphilum litorale]
MKFDQDSPLPRGKVPSISMEKSDHMKTASWGRSGKSFRAKQADLISQGRFKDAQQMDINDIRDKFGSKYDGAISQMQDYTNNLDV